VIVYIYIYLNQCVYLSQENVVILPVNAVTIKYHIISDCMYKLYNSVVTYVRGRLLLEIPDNRETTFLTLSTTDFFKMANIPEPMRTPDIKFTQVRRNIMLVYIYIYIDQFDLHN